ncbi:MAG: metallophosphoesterase N-terminal domain-containing protein, partial [Bacteroidota bacterium]
MKTLIIRTSIVLILLGSSLQCFGSPNGNNIQNEADPVKGIVFHDKTGNGSYETDEDMPLEGIAVSNGREIAITDENGEYELPYRDNAAIFVIKPQDWKVPVGKNQLPEFYYMHSSEGATGNEYEGFSPTGPLPESLNFPLYPEEEPDNYEVLVFGDSQARNEQEVSYLARDALSELKNTNAAFGVSLGDIVFDNLDVFEPLIDGIATVGIPWFYVMGNHDIDFSGDNNADARGAWYRTFGPSYYSFSYGPAHFIVLDNIRWIVEDEDEYYRTGLGEDQMEFLRNDLSRLDNDKLIVLLTHIPWTGSTDWKTDSARQAFYELIADYPNSVSLVAHTHQHYHEFIDEEQGFPG